jgi:hypothetical protein
MLHSNLQLAGAQFLRFGKRQKHGQLDVVRRVWGRPPTAMRKARPGPTLGPPPHAASPAGAGSTGSSLCSQDDKGYGQFTQPQPAKLIEAEMRDAIAVHDRLL